MARVESIENHRSTLLRCININVLIVAGLREAGVIDDALESRLEAEKAHHDKLSLLIDWINNSPDKIYDSFLQVMEENEQHHVANLLRGREDDNHVPLSIERHSRLLRIRRTLMRMIHNNVALIAELKSSRAISETDVEDLSVGNVPNYKKNFQLINAIARRSDYCFECLHDALRDTHQVDAADYLMEGEVIQVHANTSRPGLDEEMAESINTALLNESMDETTVKEIEIPHMNGLRLVGATPGNSIVIFAYCKTRDIMVTFTQLFNSGELEAKLEDFLNRIFARIEPKSTEKLKVRIRLDDEEILEIEEITGIEDWLKIDKTTSTQRRSLFAAPKPTEVEEQTSKEVVGLSTTALEFSVAALGFKNLALRPAAPKRLDSTVLTTALSHKPDDKQEKTSFFENFESLLSEEEDMLTLFHSKEAASYQDCISLNWEKRKSMLSERLAKLLDSQTFIYKMVLSLADSLKDVDELRSSAQHFDSRLKQQHELWKRLKEEVLDERKELLTSSYRTTYEAVDLDTIDFLLQQSRILKSKLKEAKEKFGKGNFFLALESLKIEKKDVDGSKKKPLKLDTRMRETYKTVSMQKPHELPNISRRLKRVLEEKKFLREHNLHGYEMSKEKQLDSIMYFGLEMPHVNAIQKNYDVLIRCTTINFYVIDSLRAKNVLDDAQESDLKAERSHLRQLVLLFQWLKVVPPHRYESFLEVMKDTQQEHVKNLLTGSTAEDYLPLSDIRYSQLAELRPNLAEVMNAVYGEVIQQLKSLKAISSIVADEIRAEEVTYTMNSKLISAIMRGSNYSYNSLKEALRKTNQTFVADILSADEIIAEHGKISAKDDIDLREVFEKLSGSNVSPVATNPGKKDLQLLQDTSDSAVK